MVGAGDGARNNGEGCHRVHGYHGGRCEEVACQHGCHASVLHAYFDGERASFGGVEAERLANEVAQQVACAVVQGDNGKCQQDESQPFFLKLRVDGEDDAAHDAGQAQYADAGHDALYLPEVFPFAQKVVEGDAERNGEECHEQDVLEHSPGIDFNLCACQPKHKQGRDEGRKAGADGCHTHAVCHIALAKETHKVAAHAAGAAANEDDACRQERIEMEKPSQHPCHNGHDGVLCHGSDKDIHGARQQDSEVFGRECAAHGQHDKPQNDRGALPFLHPCKGFRSEERNNGNNDDEKTRVASQPTAEGK